MRGHCGIDGITPKQKSNEKNTDVLHLIIIDGKNIAVVCFSCR